MTTILAIQYPNGFVIAADGKVTENERPYIHSDLLKITTHGEYTIAGSGTSRYCDIIQYGWTPPKYDGSDIYRFMVSKFIPSMRKAHEDSGCTFKDDEVFKFIVGLRNRLFYIAEDYTVLMTNTGFYGAGTGAQYGLGALAAGASLRDAMKIAIEYDVNSGGKIQIVKQGDQNA